MSTVHSAPHRVFVSAKAVYVWSLLLLVVCGALFVAPLFAHHDLRALQMGTLARFVTVPVRLCGHELLHVVGFRIAGARRVPVAVRRLRFATFVPGIAIGVVPLVAGASTGVSATTGLPWMKWTLVTLAIAAAAFVIDRLLLWAEDRDWIYYRTRKPNITSLGTALFHMQAIMEPEKQHIVETKREIKEDEDDDGGGKPKPLPGLKPPGPPLAS